ncbi:MAG: ElyC/SanA/YdcF family protein [Verrucomicrobiota bacterium]
MLQRLRSLLAKRTRRERICLGLMFGAVLFVAACNTAIVTRNASQLFTELDAIPARDVGVVFGAAPYLRDGRANLHFAYRIEAAARLYHAGKVRHLLVSGDNHRRDYDEPSAMKAALVAKGVPAGAVTCDYAGFRTLDTVARAKDVFGLSSCILVTQRYHNTRALEIARAYGIDAVGYCTREVPTRHSIRTEIREVAARTLAVLDLYVWHRGPRFDGPFEPIQI